MAYALLGILVLAIFGSFFVAYMSGKTWPIYQAVLVVFIFLGTVAFFYLAARTLATHKSWRELVRQQKQELASLESQLLPLKGGLDASGNAVAGEVPTLRHKLRLETTGRGGVFYDVAADGLKDGVVQLTLKAPEHALTENSLIYAFDQKGIAEGGRFLGEFRVVSAPEKSPAIQITSTLPLTAEQAKRLEAAIKGTWTLYTTMPSDDPDVLARLDEASRTALLGAEAAKEFESRQRERRDYRLIFHENHVQRALLADSIRTTTSNIARLSAAAEEAAKEAGFRTTEKDNLQADLKGFQSELAAITAYESSLEGLLGKVRESLRATYIENRKAAAQIAEEQLRSADEINRRTASTAGAAVAAP